LFKTFFCNLNTKFPQKSEGTSLCKMSDCQSEIAIHRKISINFILAVCVEKKNQLEATEWYIALIMCSTCFGHFYAHHQQLETLCALLPPRVCDALVARGQVQGSRLCVRDEGCCSSNLQQAAMKATHTIGGNNTHVVSNS
jgi:hypothetical protein